jgi:cytochrome P450
MTDASVVLGEDFVQQRQALYDRLRADKPVCRVVMPDGLSVWWITRYDDSRAALADPRLSKDSRKAAPLHARQEDEGVQRTFLAEVLQSHMLNMDPPEHTRLRRLVTTAFTARRVQALRPRVEHIAAELLDRAEEHSQIDLLATYAFPLSVTVAGDLFGVPRHHQMAFKSLSDRIGLGTDPEAIGHASHEMVEYLRELVELKRDQPGDDLVTALVQARDDESRLDEIELVAMCFLLLSAGLGSTGHMIGNGVAALLREPDQLTALRADPALLSGAVEELLRYEGAAGTTTLRFTTEPITIGRVEVPDGEFVLVPLGSPNRDEARFSDPHRLDIRRDTAGHLAFGHGIHFCLGAQLARLQLQVAIGQLIQRFPHLTLAVEPERLQWRRSILFHALESLPVVLSPPSASGPGRNAAR